MAGKPLSWDDFTYDEPAAPRPSGPVYGAPPKRDPYAAETNALLPARIRKAEAEAAIAEQQAERGPAPTATEVEAANKKAAEQKRAATVNAMLGEVRGLYEQDIQGQPWSRAFGATEYIDSLPRNERFTSAGNAILPLIRPLVAQSAKEGDSDKEMDVFRAYIPSNDDSDLNIEQKFKMLEMLIGGMVDGKPPSQTKAEIDGDESAGAASTNPPPPPAGSPPQSGTQGAPPPFSPGDPSYQAATGANRTVADPEMSAAVSKMVRQGSSLDEINQFVLSKGLMPVDAAQFREVKEYLRKNPGYKGGVADVKKFEPNSWLERKITEYGNNPLGAYAIGAGNILSANTLDNAAGMFGADPERARLAMNITAAQHPTATTLGEVSGGALAGVLGEGALAHLGMSGAAAMGLGRGALTDFVTGAANGAGMADDGSRGLGALGGALSSVAGGVAGNLGLRGVANMVSPTGGSMGVLYDAGVRPTLGQRLANANDGRGMTGFVGKSVNAMEEALQSVPVVGSAIRGARQEARDQFQLGAFNEALKEVGEQLPKGMRPGTDPHAYAQKVFNDVYEKARSGMRLVVDGKFANDLAELAPDISMLGPEASRRLDAVVKNVIEPRISNGQMNGNAYKRTVADLGKKIAQLRKSAMGEDQALADVLEGVRSSLDGAARRSSDPEAVQLLDAADAGYAKLVRIEGAAARRGGDDGTFSPKQFNSEVQKASGGVRSRAYLRGDALMQKYAQAASGLDDRLPNSGSADRIMAGYAAGAPITGTMAYLEPTTLGALGVAGLANAPGVRKVTKGAMAPSGPKAKAIANQLRKHAQLAGRASAATGVALLPGTSLGQ